jgi:hypothetical protein
MGLHARVEKLDLERSVNDGPRLADHLMQSLFAHHVSALLIHTSAMRRSRRSSIEEHTKG